MMTQVPEGQSAIVETDAVPEPRAAMVERNRRYENRVEESCAQVLVAIGLMHSECVLRASLAEFHEAHGARTQRRDAGQVNFASARQCELDEGLRAEFLGHRGVYADAFAGSEPSGLRNGARDCFRGAYTCEARHSATPREHFDSEG